MVVARCLSSGKAHVLGDLVLINLEVEVRLSLDLREYILANSLALLSLNLLIESEGLELLLDQPVNSAFYLL